MADSKVGYDLKVMMGTIWSKGYIDKNLPKFGRCSWTGFDWRFSWRFDICSFPDIYVLCMLTSQVMGDGKRLCVAGIVGPTRLGVGQPSFHISLPWHHLGKKYNPPKSPKDVIYGRCQPLSTGEQAVFSSSVTSHWSQRYKSNLNNLMSAMVCSVWIVTVSPWIPGVETV